MSDEQESGVRSQESGQVEESKVEGQGVKNCSDERQVMSDEPKAEETRLSLARSLAFAFSSPKAKVSSLLKRKRR